MLQKNKAALVYIISIIITYYSWLIVFPENELMLGIASILFPIIAGFMSLLWIFPAFYKDKSKNRYFWLLLWVGIVIYLIGNIIWLVSFIETNTSLFPDSSALCWMITYLIFLVALVYKMIIHFTFAIKTYLFNVCIFITVAISIVVHFLIAPVLLLSENSMLLTVMGLAYPIFSLSMLFIIICLHFLSKYSNERQTLLLINIGFLFQIIVDFISGYLIFIENYQIGSWLDPFWTMALLFLGLAGLVAQQNLNSPIATNEDYTEGKERWFPYVISILLVIIFIFEAEWMITPMGIGLAIVFTMIIGRQLVIMKKNDVLMKQYRHMAYHDGLTELKNRSSFQSEVDCFVEKAKMLNTSVSVLLLDLDRFKHVNDTLGHDVGDQLLIKASERLKQTASKESVYRLGGDEFVLVLTDATKVQSIALAETIINEFKQPFSLGHHEVMITPSIGISLYPENGQSSEALLKAADTAMYLAKNKGRNNYQFFDLQLNEKMTRRMVLENELHKAIEKKELSLFYQPKVELNSREMVGMEALLRWNHPVLGMISPLEFIPIAEETGQIVAIGEWVLKTACMQNKQWQEKGFPPLCVSVNVSVRQFQTGNFVNTVKVVLEETKLHPTFLELEITESILQNVDESLQVIKGLKEMGVKTAIDDFGKGYSSLHILRELPIDTIKIDKIFIDDLLSQTNDSMVKTIIDLGLNLNLKVVAEGVESEQQVRALAHYNCGYGQGYLFLKPVSSKEFELYLEQL
ncbi:putative bifunctional diguanylate cyclase/phosphodiesterase [Alkalihalobacterium bogoriense]|uniref:putative bifunctional diguanylate cyclase/phosphodiesterase n=1 Tax=Alkalihalobacterium bogoriense TaxID=246272 RepID=UPI0006866CC3|nr:EAL domain-containing protein [Alkalihalobacterium bogoriense]